MSDTPPRLSAARFALVSAPLALALLLFLAIGLFGLLTSIGGSATGERVQISLRSSCAQDWSTLLQKRAVELGLGDPQVQVVGDQALLLATLPGLEDDLQAIPALLSAQGLLQVYAAPDALTRPEGEPLVSSADIDEVFLQLDVSGHPFAELQLQPLAAEALKQAQQPVLQYWLDGRLVDTYEGPAPFEGAIELHPELEHTRDELRLATDWTVILRTGAAPCAADAVTVSPSP